MPFVPFPDFDPVPPKRHPLPLLHLRSHSPRWAFPRGASESQIHAYITWLHVWRTGRALRDRERLLRPSLLFRVRVFIRRLHFYLQAMDGGLPDDVLADLARRGTDEENPDG